MAQITIPAFIDCLSDVMEFVESEMHGVNIDKKKQTNIQIAVGEIFMNIADYAYPSGEGGVTVSISVNPEKISLKFSDCGEPYNPFAKEDPDTSLSVENREPGGLGIFIVKQLMDEIEYEHRDGYNILTVCKYIS